jgi:hypothetical protein
MIMRFIPCFLILLWPALVFAQYLDRPAYNIPQSPQTYTPPRIEPTYPAPSPYMRAAPQPYGMVPPPPEEAKPAPELSPPLPVPQITSEAASKQMTVDMAIIDKNLGRHQRLQVPMGRIIQYKTLEILPKRCVIRSGVPTVEQHSLLVDIYDRRVGNAASQVFSGWMFANNPSLSHLAHPYYDMVVFSCSPTPDEAPDEASSGKDVPKKKEANDASTMP